MGAGTHFIPLRPTCGRLYICQKRLSRENSAIFYGDALCRRLAEGWWPARGLPPSLVENGLSVRRRAQARPDDPLQVTHAEEGATRFLRRPHGVRLQRAARGTDGDEHVDEPPLLQGLADDVRRRLECRRIGGG